MSNDIIPAHGRTLPDSRVDFALEAGLMLARDASEPYGRAVRRHRAWGTVLTRG